jgi:hypothetical protein
MLLALKVQVVQAPPDSKYGYALMHSRGNGIVMQSMGMFANRAPASGVSVHTEHSSEYIPMEQTTSPSKTNIQLTNAKGRIRNLIDVIITHQTVHKP